MLESANPELTSKPFLQNYRKLSAISGLDVREMAGICPVVRAEVLLQTRVIVDHDVI